ncbi:MAG: DUF1015 domain-containing protein, partial [Actinomycetota bacterium]|nr:DUF1015 domain-containing protein [Actinomycetota bacterium]
ATAEAALVARPADRSARWRNLDTAVLEHAVLPRLGAVTVEYRSVAAAAAAEVEADPAAGLFLLRAVSADTVHALAATGELMPQRTTWFRPKPRAGLIMRAATPEAA